MAKLFSLFLLLFVGFFTAQSQNTIPDTFSEALDSVDALYFQYYQSDNALALLDSLSRSKTAHDNIEAQVEVLHLYAVILNDKGKYTQAISKINEATGLINERDYPITYASLFQTLGVCYDNLGFYPKAIESFLDALRIYESENDTLGISNCHNNLANIQTAIDELDDAKRNYFISLDYARALKDSVNIGIAYNNLGGLYMWEQKYDSALGFIKKALSMANALQDNLLMLSANGSMSDYYFDLGNIDSALYYQKISHQLSRDFGSAFDLANEQISIASIYLFAHRLKEAREASVLALEMAMENNIKHIINRSYSNLAQIDSINGDFKQALYFYQLAEAYSDSINNEDVAKSAVRQQLEFDFEKKEALAQLELERQQRQRNIFILGFLFMSVASGTILVQRNKISKEKDRSENLLLNILPYETAQELKEKGYADSKHIEQVTVLFTDFKGFTQLSETLPPKELVQAIHECFSAFDKIMERHNVEKIKTIGDAYMAAGGLPTPNTSHAKEVVRAALDIQDFMVQRAEEKRTKGQPFFEIRIGVHTGSVVAGIVGIKKFQYDIWGDTVNTASRMESSGEVGKVNISSFTQSLVKDNFECEYRGEVEAKGKGKIGMYFVDRKQSDQF